jgi:hypothetical protein
MVASPERKTRINLKRDRWITQETDNQDSFLPCDRYVS